MHTRLCHTIIDTKYLTCLQSSKRFEDLKNTITILPLTTIRNRTLNASAMPPIPFSALHQHSKQNPYCCFSFVVAGHIRLLCGGTFPFKKKFLIYLSSITKNPRKEKQGNVTENNSKALEASRYQTNTWV